jgi:hypothetical protein
MLIFAKALRKNTLISWEQDIIYARQTGKQFSVNLILHACNIADPDPVDL